MFAFLAESIEFVTVLFAESIFGLKMEQEYKQHTSVKLSKIFIVVSMTNLVPKIEKEQHEKKKNVNQMLRNREKQGCK
jgi:hypothetical protein